jgi:amino acid transporter
MSEITLVIPYLFAALTLGIFALACAVGLVAAIVIIAGWIVAQFVSTPGSSADAGQSRIYSPTSLQPSESPLGRSQRVNDPAR